MVVVEGLLTLSRLVSVAITASLCMEEEASTLFLTAIRFTRVVMHILTLI